MTFELTFFDNFLSFVVLVLLGVGFGFVARRTLSVPRSAGPARSSSG